MGPTREPFQPFSIHWGCTTTAMQYTDDNDFDSTGHDFFEKMMMH